MAQLAIVTSSFTFSIYLRSLNHFQRRWNILAMDHVRTPNSLSPNPGRSPGNHKRRSMKKCNMCRQKRVKAGPLVVHRCKAHLNSSSSVCPQLEHGQGSDVFLAKNTTYRAVPMCTRAMPQPRSLEITPDRHGLLCQTALNHKLRWP